MVASTYEYEVTITSTDTIAATLPVQEHRMALSNLDLLPPPLDVGVFFCYKQQPAKGAATVLKAALARVLVAYYPLAGEMVANEDGEPELLCNNRGVDFIEASANVELKEIRLGEPDKSVKGKLVPEKKDGVLCIQATEFKCGGLVIGIAFDHRIADAYSLNMFFVAWSEAARSTPFSEGLPSFSRSLLTPRCPPPSLLDPLFDRLFVPLSSAPTRPLIATSVNRIYRIAADDIAALQAETSHARTKLEAFVAYLWRVLAKAASPHQTSCCMGVVVDGRGRLRDDNDVATMQNYFGNVISAPYRTVPSQRLCGMELSDVADDVHEWVSEAATGEHFRGLVDWVEAKRPEPIITRVYLGGEDGERAMSCVVSSGRRFPVARIDFGWGRPVFGSYHFPWGGGTGYVMPMPSADGSGDWVVYVHVAPEVVKVMEEEPTLFRTLKPLD